MKKGFKYFFATWLIVLVLFNCICFFTPSSIEGKTILELIKFIRGFKGDYDISLLESYGLSEMVFNKYGGSFWSAYVCIIIAFMGLLICAYVTFKEKDNQKIFYRISLIQISYVCLIVTLVVGIMCMIIPNLSNWIGIVICFIVLVLNLIAIVKISAAIEKVEELDTNISSQTSFIRNITDEAKDLLSKATTDETIRSCQEIYDAFKYSDPVSKKELEKLEYNIQKVFNEYKTEIIENTNSNTKDILLTLIQERNTRCRSLK